MKFRPFSLFALAAGMAVSSFAADRPELYAFPFKTPVAAPGTFTAGLSGNGDDKNRRKKLDKQRKKVDNYLR